MGTGNESRTPIIEMKGVDSGYGTTVLNAAIDLEVYPGEVFGILGGSGCGKSTILKNMIGLLDPIRGTILIDGEDLPNARGEARRAIQRKFGVMYQQGALFGSMTLLENVCLPLEEHTRLGRLERERLAALKLRLVSLGGFEHYYPDEISGGMRKRAAIARALALDPRIMFLDEPSAGLDPITSAELDQLIGRLARTLEIAFVMVTHELDSILTVIDRAIVLDRDAAGIVATGSPRELRDGCTVPFVRRFFHPTEALEEAGGSPS